jgi:nitrogen regulatory protein P-II 1
MPIDSRKTAHTVFDKNRKYRGYWGLETSMKLLVFVLNKEEFLEEVLEAYVEAGVAGATILDSEGMGRFLAYEVPLFAGFKEFMKGNKPYNKTILSVIRNDQVVETLKRLVDEVVGGLDNPGTGIMFTVPVDWTSGLVREEEEV